MDADRIALARRISARARLTGRFTLRSGATSDSYFDKYAFESDPLLLREIALALAGLMPARVDVVAGLELGGIPLATVLSQVCALPTVFVRKQAKTYGTCRLAEGIDITGKRMAVIEDVITTAGQAIESVRELRKRGAQIETVLCVIDREAGGAERLAEHGCGLRALFTAAELSAASASDPLNSAETSLIDLVEAVRALPYGRPSDRTVEGMLRERRGTCSTKHLFLARRLAERFPETEPLIVHRVYRLDHITARERYGEQVAQAVPKDSGLIDVHRYLTIHLDGQRITIDTTFPGPRWDGSSPLPLACGPGDDHPASGDPEAEKRALEREHCEPIVRETFIAALAAT
ncbi:MAG: orotate phosphoribosyltransferase [Solirubrobacteraceae bacterium]